MQLNLITSAIGFGLVSASILAIAALGFTLQYALTNTFNTAYGDVMTASAFAAYAFNVAGPIYVGNTDDEREALRLQRPLFTEVMGSHWPFEQLRRRHLLETPAQEVARLLALQQAGCQ